ncbi:prolyl oligopeptidase family serine peptidase [Sanguibacter sp. Z1732]|uniref:prolyl oligopeptidase family serine peptidase n=1 Tax=Sanguibacter sp. Z1732 TaxID=3435412 RepID=UPI003D9C8A27
MTDTRIWLEDVAGSEALDWVRARNAEKAADLAATPEFARAKDRITAILDSDDKIPEVSKIGAHYYNFWKDAQHERGIWRRTTLESYRTENPDWETVLDVDALNEAEQENWVWHGVSVLPGADQEYRLAMIHLSRGGADADVSREFDLHTRRFVEGGFYRPEAKGGTSWIDEDTLFVHTDTGAGSMTSSGYPRITRRWRRGTPLEQAEAVFEGEHDDMSVAAMHDSTPGFERDFVVRALAFYNAEIHLLDGTELRRIEVPSSAEIMVHREWLAIELRKDWTPAGTTYSGGSLLVTDFDDFMAGSREFQVLYSPTPSTSLIGATWTRHHLVLNILDDVKHRLEVHTPGPDGTFTSEPFTGAEDGAVGTVRVGAVDPKRSDDLWLVTTDFLSPTTLWLARADGEPEKLKSMPAFFDAAGLVAEQYFTTSDDGTRVPYFLVRREDLTFDGTAPTLMYGYGGYEIPMLPNYNAALGAAWLEEGGVYVLTNIRGGGEYGPAWHQAAMRENRHLAYQDMAAIARDVVERGVTSHDRIGVQGGSNGGLLTGNMLVHYPELFGAIVIQVPLLDMERYHLLLAGASWIAEFGDDPDVPGDREFLRTFSPYHLFEPDAEYPPVLFTTSTRDDRVHPGHARKMADLMIEAGKDVTYYENIEGGHGGAATNAQAAHMQALVYRFLAERLDRN